MSTAPVLCPHLQVLLLVSQDHCKYLQDIQHISGSTLFHAMNLWIFNFLQHSQHVFKFDGPTGTFTVWCGIDEDALTSFPLVLRMTV